MNKIKKKNSINILIFNDPLKAKYFSKKFLKQIKIINNIKGILSYIGYYFKKKIIIIGYNIGIQFFNIHIKNLIKNYNIKKIIKIGLCGTIIKKIKLNDIIIGIGACTDYKLNRINFNNYDYSATANFDLIKNTLKIAKINKINIHIGNIFSTNLTFYNNKIFKILKKHNILGIDIESAIIYNIAAKNNIKAMTICLVSDHIIKKKKTNNINIKKKLNKITKLILKSLTIKN